MRHENAPLRVALIYVVAGALWIAVSDWLLFTLAPEDLRAGQVVKGVVFVVLSGFLIFYLVRHELQQRRSVEAEREDLQMQLAGSQRLEAIGRLTGGIAHDFNNLLTAISGNLESYIESLPHEGRHGNKGVIPIELSEAASAALRAEDLTRQLLAFGRRQDLRPQPLDLNHVIRDMGQLLHRLIGDRIEIRTVLADDLWVVDVDRGPLQQVVMNLALNARDAMPDGGRLTLATDNAEVSDHAARRDFDFPMRPGEYVRLRVEDTGIGMDPQTRQHIFEPFFTTKEKHVGTGLGMSTVFGIVKQSGGYIDLETAVGVGTSFDLYFPRGQGTTNGSPQGEVPASRVTARPPAAELRPELPAGGTILIVEDEASVRSIITRSLQRQGYRTIECAGGAQALQLLESRASPHVDLLLTDAVMPGMSGPQLIDNVRKIRPDLPALIMSGYAEDEVSSHEPYLAKPFTPAQLIARIREAMG